MDEVAMLGSCCNVPKKLEAIHRESTVKEEHADRSCSKRIAVHQFRA